MKHKMSLLALAVGSSLSAPAFADINDIVIARYLMGEKQNKAIEITNVGSKDHTFENTALYMDGFNSKGKESFQEINMLNGVTLPSGKSIVIHHKDLADNIKSVIPKDLVIEPKIANLAFNGDDALFIAEGVNTQCKADSDCYINDEQIKADIKAKLRDIVGEKTVSGNTTGWGYQKTLIRNTGPNTQPTPEFKKDDWLEYSKDDPAGLGTGVPAEVVVPEPEVGVCEGQTLTPTYAIQGDGWHSPMVDVENKKYISDDEYFVQGVVVAATTGLTKGYYIQDKNGDGNDKTSDGLLVTFSGAKDEHVGQTLCFQGRVKEDYGRTQLETTVNKFQVMDATVNKIAPTPITVIPELDTENGKLSFRATLERYEGMLVTLPEDMNSELEGKQDMRVSRTFSFDYAPKRSNMVIAYERPNMHPNQLAAAGSEASKAAIRENQDRRVFVESDAKADSEIPYFPAWNANPNANAIRVNDSVVGMRGVLDYSYNEYRLIVPSSAEFNVTKANFKSNNSARQNKPSLKTNVAADEFVLRVGSKNVLNFFNSPFKGDYNSHGLNRGAESQVEFDLQKAKLVEALYGMNADVIGLMEIENNGFGHYGAIKELVDALNDQYTEDRYSRRTDPRYVGNRYTFVAIDTNGDRMITAEDTVGSDAITTGLIYRPSKVTLEEVDIILMPRQEAPALTDDNGNVITNSNGELIGSGRAYQRDSLTGTFLVHNTGKKLTVSVNHLKSKGSACWEDFQVKDNKNNPIDVDKQGNCENFRIAGAVQLGEQLEKRYPNNDRIIMGDLNSYAKEDPMLVLTSNPTNKVLTAARDTWIGNQPQFGSDGAVIKRSFGYTHAVHMMDEKYGRQPSWSYSYNDEIGSLDHMLVSPGLKLRVVDAIDWNINSSETPLFDYQKKHAGAKPGNFHGTDDHVNYSGAKATAFRSSDHDPVIMALSYKYTEPGLKPVRFVADSSRVDIPFVVNAEAKKGDKAYLVITSGLQSSDKPQIPVVELKKDGLQTVNFNVVSLPRGEYTVLMYLMREEIAEVAAITARSSEAQSTWSEVVGSSKQLTIEIASKDSIGVGKVAVPSYDGTGGGGAFGGFGLLSLLTFGWFRRRR
ncbi:ExeM/NucH family extracellular endonuclease [Vibrio metschnikovii]|uniref:ExeM/NucH family extracellular endonuclease n=1 Tax=Vibrio metschnikovii TaxID=28172 RepID=UPI001C3017B5|nr:ExeM/NucH family extracellular endonuclease [Vibrio metschnikovii]